MFSRIKTEKINDHIWLMNDNDEATGYLVTGTEKALVIDTMNGYEDVRKLAETLTDLPLIVVNTHGHPDHVYGDVYFEEVYMHPDDHALAKQYMHLPAFKEEMKRRGLKMPRLLSVREGDQFDLGKIALEVYHVPGHTPGGICLLDRKDRLLFTGDSVIEQTWMQMDESLPMHVFLDSLESLGKIRSAFDYILTGHTRMCPEDASLCEAQRRAVTEVINGQDEGDMPYEWYGGLATAHPYGPEPRRIVYRRDRLEKEGKETAK